MTTNKTAKESSDNRLSDYNLIVNRASFKMQKLNAYGLGTKNGFEVIGVDTVLADEALKDMEPFGS